MSDVSRSAGARAPNPVLAALGRTLETVLNRALALDADTRARVAALDGRAVTLELRRPALALRIAVAGERLEVGPAFAADSALRVSATPASLLALALARGDDAAPPSGGVEIAGDAELARRLEQLVRRFEPDIEEAFARVFGDVAGVALARALRRALAWSRDSARALAADTAEYLTMESGDLVAKAELDEFLDEVDLLRERADRLEARLRRLAARAAVNA
ncbi:MAG: sterol-binding protein [Rhodanobacteraceae bacterium]|jgi:ubiquinone biosynthesis protein UbiJ|nr:sterol-binding protein [Rhodanobacteraceae bacterium]